VRDAQRADQNARCQREEVLADAAGASSLFAPVAFVTAPMLLLLLLLPLRSALQARAAGRPEERQRAGAAGRRAAGAPGCCCCFARAALCDSYLSDELAADPGQAARAGGGEQAHERAHDKVQARARGWGARCVCE
jgi:hypothetical protein